MTTCIALLRAVNLPSHNKIAMRDLCALLESLGMHDARSLLQSGNLVFRSDQTSTPRVEQLLEQSAAGKLGLETEFFVRNAAEWDAIIAGNPFPKQEEHDPARLLVLLLKKAPDRKAVLALQEAITGREVVGVAGRHAYAVYPDGIGRSRLTTTLIEKKLGTSVTGRNWNTVLKIRDLGRELTRQKG